MGGEPARGGEGGDDEVAGMCGKERREREPRTKNQEGNQMLQINVSQSSR